jgi:hypothetical protein
MDEPKRLDLKHQSTMQIAALVVLLDRAGGSIEFDLAEFEEARARRGGAAKMVIHHEVLQQGKKRSIRVTLIRKDPVNAELPT